MNFKIVTDSTANLSTEYFNVNDIAVVTLYYSINGDVFPAYKTGDSNLLKNFYQTIQTKPKLSTSCANEEQYFKEFEKAVKENKPVIYIGFSAGVSATFSSAELAKERILKEFPNAEIYCVDTHTGSFGQGYFVEQAVNMRREGKSVKEVAEFILKERDNMNTYVTVDDLFYLHKGGRIPSLAYRIGTMIKIKPIIKVNEEGKLVSVNKVISRKQSIRHLANIINENARKDSVVYISHADCENDAKELETKITSKHIKEVKIGYLEAVIGSHTGVGGLAVFFLKESR